MISYILNFVISCALVLIIMPFFINWLKMKNISQEVSEYALEEYKKKAKTPIMGGLLFVAVPVAVYAALHASSLGNKSILFVFLSYILFCTVGFADDYMIIVRHNNDGLSPKTKLAIEFVYTVILFFLFKDVISTRITVPFTSFSFDLGILYLPFMIAVFLSEANAVNFTDGMDGLCAGVSFIALISYVVMAIVSGNTELAALLFCVEGGLIGYLYYNHYPAKIFMGDSGSLALGALFTSVAIVLNKELTLIFVGGVFLYEMLCVCIQLTSVILFKRRVFSYTPIHYAFVLKGNKETKVVFGFYCLAFVCMVLGLFAGLIG